MARDGFLGDAAPLPERKSLAGLVVGTYTLRAPIGQGGMGQVWLAERTDGRFEGRAAVKLLNISLIGREGEARFRREGSLLARLRHPGIAHLVDAGVTSMGQPYLVLEHVDGEPIDHYCDAHRLPVETRLRLFLEVLAAVGFAHANLVVHRDLKPPNILVGKEGRVRLLDFGIAKLLDPEGGPETGGTLTREGGAAMTPEYAAPEQLTGGVITTATDVYTLGVLLQVLLTGQHPAGRDIASPAALFSAVVEGEPVHPSDAVVSTRSLTRDDLDARAARRGVAPARLRRLLQGDLDNIVARALKKDPRERYPSVLSLADDLRRHLNSEPVSARPDSLAYRAARFVRRHRTGVAAAALVVIAVLAGLAGVAWQAREAAMQRDAARAHLARATAANDFTASLLGTAAPNGRRFNVGELLEVGEEMIERQFAHDDALRAEMLIVVGQQYMLAQRLDRAGPVLERAAAISGRLADPGLRARALCPLAFVKMLDEQRAEAQSMITGALAGLTDAPQYDLERAECLVRRGEFGFVDGDAAAMIGNAQGAMALLDRTRSATRTRWVDALGTLAYGYYLARRNGEAERTFAQVMQALEEDGRDRSFAAVDTLNNWALVYFAGDISRAEPLCRRVVELLRSIEGGDSTAPTYTFNLAGVLLALARHDEAEPLLEATIRSAAARQERRIQLDAMMQLAEVHIARGDLDRAATQLDTLTPFLGTPHYDRFRQAQMNYYRGRLAEARGDLAAARGHYSKAVEIFEGAKAKIAMNVPALIGLAGAEQALGNGAAAASAVDRALTLAESFVEKGAPSYLIGLSLAARGEILAAAGRPDEARATFRTASEHLSRTLGPGHPDTRRVLARVAS